MDVSTLKPLAEKLPEDVRNNAKALLAEMETVIEGIGDEPVDWRAPTVKLIQPSSDRSGLPRGVSIGDLVLGEEKLPSPLNIIPIRMWDGRQFWSPDPNESRMLCSSMDGKIGYTGVYCNQCPHAVFNEEARKSECSKVITALCITRDLSKLFLINFSKTNYATGTSLKQYAKLARVPLYRRVYELSTQTNKAYKNVENMVISTLEGDAKTLPADLAPFVERLFNIVDTERRAAIENFHTSALSRAGSAAAALPAQEGTVLIGSSAEGTSEPSELAKRYEV